MADPQALALERVVERVRRQVPGQHHAAPIAAIPVGPWLLLPLLLLLLGGGGRALHQIEQLPLSGLRVHVVPVCWRFVFRVSNRAEPACVYIHIHTYDHSSAVQPHPIHIRPLTLDEPRRQLLGAPVEIGNRAALFLLLLLQLLLLLLLLRPRRGVVTVERGGEGVQDGELFVGVCVCVC